jgi:hypothetical protein
LSEIFEPTVAAIPDKRRAAAELFHEVLEHRWFMSEREGRDVDLSQAVAAYIDEVLPSAPDERTALLRPRGS